jgi:hypothetical protein
MANFEREKALVQLLLGRLGLHGFLSDLNADGPETGIDVMVDAADDCTIGIQVTEADPHLEAGRARGREKRAAGTDTSKVYHGWAQNDLQIVLGSLSRSINRKVAIAARHSFASVGEVWLLICAGIPEHGAVISTIAMTPWLSAADLNRTTHSALQQSKYDRSFLLTILGAEQVLYRWERNCGWRKSVKLNDPFEAPREAYVDSLQRAAQAGDWQEVDRLCDEECKETLREMREAAATERDQT